jgi:hypothetical protein
MYVGNIYFKEIRTFAYSHIRIFAHSHIRTSAHTKTYRIYKPSTAFNFGYPFLLTGICAPDFRIAR